jgi:hypothetical protein
MGRSVVECVPSIFRDTCRIAVAVLHCPQGNTMLSTANITMQFGAKPLFENVSVKLTATATT